MPERWTDDLGFLREVAGRSTDSDLTLAALSRIEDHLADYATLKAAATTVVAYWDSLDAVQEDDERPTELFKTEMDGRIDELRGTLEGSPTPAHQVEEECAFCGAPVSEHRANESGKVMHPKRKDTP